MANSIIEIQSEYDKLMEEIHRLKSRIISLTALRDDLLYHVCPALEAEYEEKIAGLERELIAAYLYLNTLRRTIELLQAQINSRRKRVSVEEAEAQAQEEFRQAQEDINKKAEEAKKARDEWQGGSNWSEFDKEAKKRKKEEASQDSAGTEENAGSEETKGKTQEKNRGAKHDSDEDEWERMGREDEEENDSAKGYDKEGQSDDDSRDGDQANQQNGEGGSANKDESTAVKIKRLYRKIVKRLHPDVHPNPTEREKELLNKAHEAYKKGDLDALQMIWEELAGADVPEDKFEDTPEDIARIKEVIRILQGLCDELIRQIQKIKGEFPYTMKSFLEDEEAVAEKRFVMSGELSDVRNMCSKLVDEIERLRSELVHGA